MAARIVVDQDAIVVFCQRWNVAELALFGSVLRDDFAPDSDVDVLVTWLPDVDVSMLTIGAMTADLEDLLGRRIDLVPKRDLKPFLRDAVLSSSEVLYSV